MVRTSEKWLIGQDRARWDCILRTTGKKKEYPNMFIIFNEVGEGITGNHGNDIFWENDTSKLKQC